MRKHRLFKVLAMCMFALCGQSTFAQTDITATYMKDADLSVNANDPTSGWEIGYEGTGNRWGFNNNEATNYAEAYSAWGSGEAGNAMKAYSMKQNITLPVGEYRLTVHGFYRYKEEVNTDKSYAYLVAGENKVLIRSISTETSRPGDAKNASAAFKRGEYLNTLDFTIASDGTTISVGVEGTHPIDEGVYYCWFPIGPFKLYQLDLSTFKGEYETAYNAVEALLTASGINTGLTSVVNTALSNYSSTNVNATKEGYQSATTALNNVATSVNEILVVLNDANDFILACEELAKPANSTPNTDSDLTTFNNAITTAEANLDAAGAIEAINSVISTLTTARNAYYINSEPTGEAYDMTQWIKNTKFDENIDGWKCNTDASSQVRATNQSGDITGGYFESWDWDSYTGAIYQDLTDLPEGTYTLKAAVFRDQLITNASEGDAVYLFANDDKHLVTSTNGQFVTVTTYIEAGDILSIGIKSEVKKYRWMGIDNVSLAYLGTVDMSLILELSDLVNTAESIKTSPMQSTVREALVSLINISKDAIENHSVAQTDIDNMEVAIANAQESINAYSKLAVYLDYFDGIDKTGITYWTDQETGYNTIKTNYTNGAFAAAEIESSITSLCTIWTKAVVGTTYTAKKDLTKAILNNSFETGDLFGWTLTSTSSDTQVCTPDESHATSGGDGSYIFNTWWKGVPIRQTVNGLPKGKYKLSVLYASDADCYAYLAANGTPGELLNSTIGNGTFMEVSTYAEVGEDGVLNIEFVGAKQDTHEYDPANPWYWYKVDNFRLTSVDTEVELTMTDAGWATLILPFAAEVPDNLTAYTCVTAGANNVLTLEDATSLTANTPYILGGTEGTYTFTGFATNLEDTYTNGLLTGTFVETSAPVGSYVLQNKDGKVGFYQVEAGKQPTVKANRAYLTPVGAEANVLAFFFPGDDVTGIEATEVDNDTLVNVYTLAGVPVRMNVKMGEALQGLEKGIYIVGGVKKAVK